MSDYITTLTMAENLEGRPIGYKMTDERWLCLLCGNICPDFDALNRHLEGHA